MTSVYIVTEGISDRLILEAVLTPEVLAEADFIVGSGRYSAQSLARSVLATEQVPVAFVVDADTTVASIVQEQRELLRYSLGQASSGVRFEVFLAMPEIEILLVQDLDLIESLTGRSSCSEIEIEFAQLHPKKFLGKHLGQGEAYIVALRQLLADLSHQSIATIRQYPLVTQLSQFVLSVVNQRELSSVR